MMTESTMKQEAPKDHPQSQMLYDYGYTTYFSCKEDPRFSYCLYVPATLKANPAKKLDLVVAVHGTKRLMEVYRSALAEFAKWNDCIILVPLFPAGVLGDGYRDGYKYFIEGDIRYDSLVMAMVEEVAQKYQQTFDKFAMFGFSGGGQFVNRFALLHPERLWAASIGAPGHVTLPDDANNWWVGTRDMKHLFGKRFDASELAKVPLHLVVGSQDTESWEITVREGEPQWMPNANSAGKTRIDRLRTLRQALEEQGARVQLDIVPGAAHDVTQCIEPVKDFFKRCLDDRRREQVV